MSVMKLELKKQHGKADIGLGKVIKVGFFLLERSDVSLNVKVFSVSFVFLSSKTVDAKIQMAEVI